MMAIGGMTPYAFAVRDTNARIETVRPVERRNDDSGGRADARPAPPPESQPPAAKSGTGRLVDLFV